MSGEERDRQSVPRPLSGERHGDRGRGPDEKGSLRSIPETGDDRGPDPAHAEYVRITETDV